MTDMTHIVALSGGKDSTAMALRLTEMEPRDYQYVVTPTGAQQGAQLGTSIGQILAMYGGGNKI